MTATRLETLGFFGFGQAGSGLARGLHESGLAEIYFFDPLWERPPQAELLRKRAAESGAVAVSSPEDLLRRCQVVISCVGGAVAVAVARAAQPFLHPGHLYADANTSSPKVMEEVAALVAATGASFVDVAIMGAVPAFLHRVPMVASGPGAELFRQVLEPYGCRIRCVGPKPGQASASKMLRSVFMKGLVALLLEMLTATHKCGVDDLVLESVAESMEKASFLETVRLQMAKGVVHAERMAHEMSEVVRTLEELGLPGGMAAATREKLNWCAGLGLKEYFGGEMPETLEQVLEALAARMAAAANHRKDTD